MKTPLLTLLALLATLPSHAETLIFGVEQLEYLPYYSVEKGEYVGYSRDLFDAFAKDNQHSIEYRPLPVERLYRALLDDKIDFKYPDNPSWRKELREGRTLIYSLDIAPFLDGVLVRPGQIASPGSGLKRYGTIRGFTPWPLLPAQREGRVELSENNTMSGLLRQVLAGRLDGAYVNVDVAKHLLSRTPTSSDGLVFDPDLPHSRAHYHLSTLNYPTIIAELNDWLLRNQDRVIALQRKWNISQ